MEVTVNHDLCKKCEICIQVCPPQILALDQDGWPCVEQSVAELCIQCGHCLASCPHEALNLPFMKRVECSDTIKPPRESYEMLASLVKNRRSIRVYKDRAVPGPDIEELIRTVSHAPTARNLQPVAWTVFKDRKDMHRLSQIVVDWMKGMLTSGNEAIFPTLSMEKMVGDWDKGVNHISRGAPHVIFAHGPKNLAASAGSCLIALATLELLACAKGLGACWGGYLNICANNFPPMLEALGLPEDHLPFGSMMLGYPKYPYSKVPQRNHAVITWK